MSVTSILDSPKISSDTQVHEAHAPSVASHAHEPHAGGHQGHGHHHHSHGEDEVCETCERTRNSPWTFLTHHSHVLICIAREGHSTLREVAQCVGITERAVQRIVADLENAGIILRSRVGRTNRYRVNFEQTLRHDLESHKTVGDLMAMVLSEK